MTYDLAREKASADVMSRRSFLGLTGAVGAALLLGACSSDGDGTATTGVASAPTSIAGPPGGQLRVGALGAALATLDPAQVQGNADYLAVLHVFDSLVRLKGGEVELWLAESIEPNADATTWTLRLRPDATFHDGAPVRAADAAYSLRTLAASPFFGQFLADIDHPNLRVRDERTVEMPLLRPRADLVEGALAIGITVYPDGATDFSRPVGSGPFRVASFEPGRSTVLEANPDHWSGAPMVQRVEITTVADATARLDGVRSGALDLAMRVTPAGARSAGDDVVAIRGVESDADVFGFVMNITKAPFDLPEVRRACKLACDRQALVDTVMLGQGTVGNDLMGLGMAGYDRRIPQREHDPDEARRLFASAGVRRLSLRVADLTPGIVAAGELYAEQLRAVGVDTDLQRADAATYFNDYAALLATPFQGIYFINRPVAAALPFLTGSRSTFNLSSYAPPGHDDLLARAQSTLDARARAELFHQAQRGVWADGGDLLWGYQRVLHAVRPGVEGVVLTQSFPLLADVTVPS